MLRASAPSDGCPRVIAAVGASSPLQPRERARAAAPLRVAGNLLSERVPVRAPIGAELQLRMGARRELEFAPVRVECAFPSGALQGFDIA
jgi:hypothetical protein